MPSRRQERISEMLREELSILISTELNDPRLEDALVAVTDVTVSPDLHNARVFIEHVLPHESDAQVLSALRHSVTFIRLALIENLNLRAVPELTFQIDRSNERGHHIDELLDSLAHTNPTPPSHETESAD
jgi:ribosome-binding factor A